MATDLPRRRAGWAPHGGIHPAQVGIVEAGPQHDRSQPQLGRRGALRVLLHLARVREVLQDPLWPYSPTPCPLMAGCALGQHHCPWPCRQLSCRWSLVGHIGALGLPVLYVSRLPEDPDRTCILSCRSPETFRAIGELLDLSRQRVQQVEARARARLLAAARRLA